MRIAVCSSMVFTEKMIEMKKQLEAMGHTVYISDFAHAFVGKTEAEKEQTTQYYKNEHDAIRAFWKHIQESDAILVLNYDRRGVKNYIGGNSFLEIGFAHVLNKKIFLLNPIPDIQYYHSEIEAMKPVVIHGDLSKLK